MIYRQSKHPDWRIKLRVSTSDRIYYHLQEKMFLWFYSDRGYYDGTKIDREHNESDIELMSRALACAEAEIDEQLKRKNMERQLETVKPTLGNLQK